MIYESKEVEGAAVSICAAAAVGDGDVVLVMKCYTVLSESARWTLDCCCVCAFLDWARGGVVLCWSELRAERPKKLRDALEIGAV